MIANKKDCKAVWVGQSHTHLMPWGSEQVWQSLARGIHGKLLSLQKGKRTSLKYHMLKDEVLFVIEGKVHAYYGDELSILDPHNHPIIETILEPGVALNIQSGCPYRLTAIEDSKIMEIGNERNDKAIRIDDDYGRIKQ